MPAVAQDEETAKVERRSLAQMLGVTPNAVSTAAHEKYFCKGYPVFEWAVWHPRGTKVRHYQVPKDVLRDLVPKDEHYIYGL
jgi:hypothetical protein